MSKKEKKPSRLARLEAYADGRHHFIAAANLMSAVSSVIGVVPFYFLWKIADTPWREGPADCSPIW